MALSVTPTNKRDKEKLRARQLQALHNTSPTFSQAISIHYR